MMTKQTCPRCDAPVEKAENICGGCGYDFRVNAEESRIGGYLEADIAAVVQKNVPSYLAKFRRIEQGKLSFNWCALLFSNGWLAYRRLYGWAAGIILLGALLGIAVACVFVPFLLSGVLTPAIFLVLSFGAGFALRVACGFLSDGIYWNRVKKTLGARGEKEQTMWRGPSAIAAVVSLVGSEVFLQLFTTYVTPAITLWLMGL